jgi:hypothetical protein
LETKERITLKDLDCSIDDIFHEKFDLQACVFANLTPTSLEVSLFDQLIKLFKVPDNGIFFYDVMCRMIECRESIDQISNFKINSLFNDVVNVLIKIKHKNGDVLRETPIVSQQYTVKAIIEKIKIYQNSAKGKEKFNNTNMLHKQVEKYLKKHTENLKRENCIYAAMMWPLIDSKNEVEIDAIKTNAKIKGLVFNAFFETKKDPFDPRHNESDYHDWLVLRQLVDIKCLNEMKFFNFYDNNEYNINALYSRKQSDSTFISDRLFRVGKYLNRMLYPQVRRNSTASNSTKNSRRKSFVGLGYIRLDASTFKQESIFFGEKEIIFIVGLDHSEGKNFDPKDGEAEDTLDDNFEKLDDFNYNDVYFISQNDCTEKQNLDVTVNSGQRAIHYVETAHQYIYSRISNLEINSLINVIVNVSSDKSSSLYLKVSSIFVLCVLLFSFNPRRPPYVTVSDSDVMRENSVFLKSDGSLLSCPNFVTLNHSSEIYQRMVKYTFYAVPDCLKSILKNLMIDLKLKFSIFENISKINEGLEKIFLAAELGHLSIHDVYKYSFQSLLSYANGDLWVVGKIGQHEDLVAKTQNHYSTIREQILIQVYENHVYSIFKEKPEVLIKKSNNNAGYVGNEFTPTKRSLKKLFNEIISCVNHILANNSLIKLPIDQLVNVANLMAIYIDQMIAYSCATRDKEDNYIYPDSVDFEGFTWINDKNRSDGYHAHLGFVSDFLKSELMAYEQFKKLVVKRIVTSGRQTTRSLKADYGLLLLEPAQSRNVKVKVPRFCAVPFTRTRVVKLMSDSVRQNLKILNQLKTNSNRHYIRSALIEKRANAEYIDAYLGHWQLGTEPWHKYSLFDPLDYRKTIKKYVLGIVSEISVEPLLHNVMAQISPIKEEDNSDD